jgi:cobalt-zinc-cadmium efflux system protein
VADAVSGAEQQVLAQVTQLLHEEFDISHVTLQVEGEGFHRDGPEQVHA